MTIIARLAAATAALALAAGAQGAPRDPKALEAAFDAQVSSADQLGWLKEMSSAPNQVGSPHDRANAEMELALFKRWGWDAHIETFQVLYPTPISTTLELVAPERVQLGGQEPAVAEDPSSQHLAGALPPYVAYQGDMATSPRAWCTSITACPRITTRWRSAASTCAARSCCRAMAAAGAG